MGKLCKFVNDLFEVHKLVRRTLVVFAMGLVGWTTVILYQNIELITNPVVGLHSITVGILSAAIARYFFDRSKEDSSRLNSKGEKHER